MMKNMLIVEDHPFVAEATKAFFLAMADHHVEICRNSDEAISRLHPRNDWFRIWLDAIPANAGRGSLVRVKLGARRTASIQ